LFTEVEIDRYSRNIDTRGSGRNGGKLFYFYTREEQCVVTISVTTQQMQYVIQRGKEGNLARWDFIFHFLVLLVPTNLITSPGEFLIVFD
jgi:hypothetical protein